MLAGKVERASVQYGTRRTTILDSTKVNGPIAIAVDFEEKVDTIIIIQTIIIYIVCVCVVVYG